MLHPRLTPLGDTPGGSSSVWLAQIGPYGAWGDLAYSFRWGQGACGMFEASFTLPLPANFEDPLLRRGTQVELMDGPYRVGSPLVMAEPGRGTGLGDPWQVTCTGVGRLVEGDHSIYARDSGGNSTTIPSTAVDVAVSQLGLPWSGRDSSVPTSAVGDTTPDGLLTVGAVLTSSADYLGQRWGVGQDGYVRFMSDPTTPKYHVVPGAASLGTADDDFASHVLVRYLDSTSTLYTSVGSTNTQTEQRFGHREFAVDLTSLGAITAAQAQSYADGILAKSKGRLAWTNGLTLTKYELLTSGGVPANLSKAAEDVGSGCMVRLHGVWDDLLEFTGNTFLDVIIGEAKPSPDGQTIDLNPLGLAPRDLAAVIESVTGIASAA